MSPQMARDRAEPSRAELPDDASGNYYVTNGARRPGKCLFGRW